MDAHEEQNKSIEPMDFVAQCEAAAEACPALMAQRVPTVAEPVLVAMRRALALARESREWTTAARLAGALAVLYFDRLNLHDARLNALEAVSILRTTDDKKRLAQNLSNLATIEYCLGNIEDALIYAREAVELAAGLDSLLVKGYFLCTLGAVLAYKGDYAAAQTTFTEAQLAISRVEDDLGMAWWQFSHSREIARDRNEYAAAIKPLEEALPVLREHTAPQVVIEVLLTLADCYLLTKDLIKSDNLLKEAEGLLTSGKRFWSRPELFLLKSRFAVAEENQPQAIKFAYTGLGMVGDQGDHRMLVSLYRALASLLEQDRSRGDDTQDALDRAIAIGRKRARRVELALALKQAGLYLKHFGNRPTIRARSAGFLYEAERMIAEMGLLPAPLTPPTPSAVQPTPITPDPNPNSSDAAPSAKIPNN